MLTRLLTGRAATPRDEPIQAGTTLAHPPCLKAWQNPGEHRPLHRVGNLGPGGATRGGSNPPARTPLLTCAFAILTGWPDAHGLLTTHLRNPHPG
jgi:hypothetical protein